MNNRAKEKKQPTSGGMCGPAFATEFVAKHQSEKFEKPKPYDANDPKCLEISRNQK